MSAPITLYQFELCPFCHKVKAALELEGIPFVKVEVNPMTKKELPELEGNEKRKVPVIDVDGRLIADSSAILAFLENEYQAPYSLSSRGDEPNDTSKSQQVEAWVDEDLAQVLPAVIYGKWRDALRAAKVVAKSSNFGVVQNAVVRGGGSLIMHQVAKKIVARRGGENPQQMLDDEMDKFEQWLGDDDFIGGSELCIGDAAAHGCLTCIQDFPAFEEIMRRPKVQAWYQRVQALRSQRRAA
ncbi:MAG: glutathione S-transferase family protein [Deltaproteobacteria bacterium]|nr:glutathione S-transferase family protein [Deltaproteobacteria bacterium]